MNVARSIRTPFSPIRLLAVALALVAGFALAAVVAVPASAHVVLQGAEPPVDATVEAAPAQVIVLFSGEVSESGSTLTVVGPDGQPADAGDGGLDLNSLDRNRMVVTLLPSLPAGLYTVSYSATPADGHEPAVGSYTFTLGVATGVLATPVATPVGTPDATPIATPIALGDAPAASANGDGLSTANLLLVAAALAVLLGGGLAVIRATWRH